MTSEGHCQLDISATESGHHWVVGSAGWPRVAAPGSRLRGKGQAATELRAGDFIIRDSLFDIRHFRVESVRVEGQDLVGFNSKEK